MKKMRYLRAAATALLVLPLMHASADDTPKKCRYVNLKSIPITLEGGVLHISGSINGTDLPMTVDTGAQKTTLMRWTVDKLGLRVAHSNISLAGAGGESASYVATVSQFSIGPLAAHNLPLTVAWNTSAMGSAAALVGADFLMQHDLELSIKDGQLKFFHPLGCNDAFLAYWNPDASVVPFETDAADNLRPIVTVELNGTPVRALIDTGATVSVVTLAAAARAGVTPTSPHVRKDAQVGGIGEHRFETWIAPFSSFALGPEVSEHLHLRIGNMWAGLESDVQRMGTSQWIGEQPEMILGMDFLKHHRLLFSMAQHRLYFSYEGGAVFAPAPAQAVASPL